MIGVLLAAIISHVMKACMRTPLEYTTEFDVSPPYMWHSAIIAPHLFFFSLLDPIIFFNHYAIVYSLKWAPKKLFRNCEEQLNMALKVKIEKINKKIEPLAVVWQ